MPINHDQLGKSPSSSPSNSSKKPSGSFQPTSPTGVAIGAAGLVSGIHALKIAAATPPAVQKRTLEAPSCCMRAPNSKHLRPLEKIQSKFTTPKAAQEALFAAARSGNTQALVDALHCSWTNINRQDDRGKSAIEYAAEYGKVDAVTLLLQHGAAVPSKLITGLKYSNVDRGEVVQLLDMGINRAPTNSQWSVVNAEDLARVDSALNTKLHVMVKQYKFKELIALCKSSGRQGADLKELVNAKNALGDTALHLAAQYASGSDANVELIQQLCDMGADPTLKNNSGETPIHLTGNLPILQIFTRHFGEDATQVIAKINRAKSAYEAKKRQEQINQQKIKQEAEKPLTEEERKEILQKIEREKNTRLRAERARNDITYWNPDWGLPPSG